MYNLTATLLECMQTEGSAPCCQHSYICWLGDRFTVPLCKWSIFIISRSHKYDLSSDETSMLNKPRKSFMQPMTVCLPWLNSYRWHTQLYGRLWKYLSSYSKLVDLCVWICLCGIRWWKPHVWWFLEMMKLMNLLQRCWVERAGLIAWCGRSCDFTAVDISWSNDTEHIYIPPFCVPLMEGHTEIEQVLRPAVIRDCV